MESVVGPVHLENWIGDHAASFRPPVSNKVIATTPDFITMVVKGPNRRNDFHINPGDEVFQQLKGSIRVDIRDPDGRVRQIVVAEGELLVVPGGVPHSPRRPADTWGLVIERTRIPGELDQIAWYCDNCTSPLHTEAFQLANIETELGPILQSFAEDRERRRCAECGHVLAPGTEITL